MDYLCAECSTQLSKWEMFLNKKYGLGKLYCEFCNTKKEREAINELVKSESSMEDDWTRKLIHQEFTEDLTKGKK
jgi:hypothetical protein|tara:strand:+ start:526 stop:750 length:225 start_codon:yes stop_codon:yes gene_type:complete